MLRLKLTKDRQHFFLSDWVSRWLLAAKVLVHLSQEIIHFQRNMLFQHLDDLSLSFLSIIMLWIKEIAVKNFSHEAYLVSSMLENVQTQLPCNRVEL